MAEHYEITTRKIEMPNPFEGASAWEWQGDPERRHGYTVIGRDNEDEELALVAYDSLSGSTSQPLSAGIPGEWIMDRPKAEELHDRIQTMDSVYWPGFHPTLVRVENGEVVERFHPPEQNDEPVLHA